MSQPVTRIRARNFRSLKDVDVHLAPLSVLIGPNGSGKTTHGPWDKVVEGGTVGGVGAWTRAARTLGPPGTTSALPEPEHAVRQDRDPTLPAEHRLGPHTPEPPATPGRSQWPQAPPSGTLSSTTRRMPWPSPRPRPASVSFP